MESTIHGFESRVGETRVRKAANVTDAISVNKEYQFHGENGEHLAVKFFNSLTSRTTTMASFKDVKFIAQHETTTSTNTKGSLRILGTVVRIDDNESFYNVEYLALGGNVKTMLVPRELFRIPAKVADMLVRAGADLSDPVEAVKAAFRSKGNHHYELTRRTGWHGPASFVYPTETFGDRAGALLYDSEKQIDPALGLFTGTAKAWRKGLRASCKFSDYALFAASVPSASGLLDIIGQDEGAIFHFHGTHTTAGTDGAKTKSSSGKTLVTRIGVSAVGQCRKTDLATFAITKRGIEDFCFSHNHLTAALDEEGRATDSGATGGVPTAYLPYLIPGGRGTMRSKKAMQDRDLQNLTWALLAISNGENPLDGPSARGPRPEGAQTRMICIPVPAGHEGGIFNRVSGSPREISKQCKELAREVEQTSGRKLRRCHARISPEDGAGTPKAYCTRPGHHRRLRKNYAG